ncbi:hypothetical protein [Tritonibacter mobilis]|uniref:hypothetical protein n=1 Tax=Tritonibacter mobilis TaxID=379347 RepID=UPI003A5C06C7
MRIAYWIPIAMLALVLAVVGFRYGLIRQGITETDVITLYAQKYLGDHADSGALGSAQISDCAARPAERGHLWTWLVVTCRPEGHTDAGSFRYRINWLGGLIEYIAPGEGAPRAPQT